MTVIVKQGTINDGENVYHVGDRIYGLSKQDEASLIDSGVADFASDEIDLIDLPITADLTSLEEFAKLKADKQKEVLESLEIEPATNAEDRFKQYSEWYETQVSNDDEI